jgi:ubiquitin C-terminal hydrolase
LLNCKEFIKIVKSKNNSIIINYFLDLLNTRKTNNFYSYICKKYDLKVYRQEDASEILSFILNNINDELKINKKNIINEIIIYKKNYNNSNNILIYLSFLESFYKEYSKITPLFYGTTYKIITCLDCNNVIIGYDTFNNILLGIENCNDLYDCLGLYFKNEKLNDYKCEKCNNFNIISKLKFQTLPKYLFITFKLFDNSKRKINKQIKFPIKNLNIGDYTQNNITFSLKSLIIHIGGSIQSGHYVSIVKNKKKWYLINDNSIQEVNDKYVLSSNPYTLVYRQD